MRCNLLEKTQTQTLDTVVDLQKCNSPEVAGCSAVLCRQKNIMGISEIKERINFWSDKCLFSMVHSYMFIVL